MSVMLMEVWHWTPLVVLLAYAGLRAIPDAYYQAARIDGASAWAVFRYIQLPKMRGVLTIAILLRFMFSFLIYTEPFVLTGGGPGNSTTFLSIYLVKIAVGEFDVGRAGAFSIIYFLIVLAVQLRLLSGAAARRHGREAMSSLTHAAVAAQSDGAEAGAAKRVDRAEPRQAASIPMRTVGLVVYLLLLLLPIYWMLNMSLRDNNDIMTQLALLSAPSDVPELREDIHRSLLVHGLRQFVRLRQHQHRHLAGRRRCRRPTRSRATASSATSISSSGC